MLLSFLPYAYRSSRGPILLVDVLELQVSSMYVGMEGVESINEHGFFIYIYMFFSYNAVVQNNTMLQDCNK